MLSMLEGKTGSDKKKKWAIIPVFQPWKWTAACDKRMETPTWERGEQGGGSQTNERPVFWTRDQSRPIRGRQGGAWVRGLQAGAEGQGGEWRLQQLRSGQKWSRFTNLKLSSTSTISHLDFPLISTLKRELGLISRNLQELRKYSQRQSLIRKESWRKINSWVIVNHSWWVGRWLKSKIQVTNVLIFCCK